MGTDTAVLFKTSIGKTAHRGIITKVTDHESKWSDKLYEVLLDSGEVRIAYPDELTVIA